MHTTLCGQLFPTPSQEQLLSQLMRLQSSAMRSAYVQLCKHISKSKIEQHLAYRYPGLNSRYLRDGYTRAKIVYDAACELVKHGRLLSPAKLVFGNRRNFQKRQTQKIKHSEWQQRRRNQLYSRGERAKHGNLNLRFLYHQGQLMLRVTVGSRTWMKVSVFLPHPPDSILQGTVAYSVRIIRHLKGYRLCVGFEIKEVPQVDFHLGAVGVDFNHDTIDLAVSNQEGQLRATRTLRCHELTCARRDKRHHRIGNLAKQVVAYALYWKRGIVLEDLQNVTRGQFNQHQFTYRRFIDTICRRAEKEGVAVRVVNPAYTSVIGAWKYAPYYNLTVHQAAALVVARRGQGLSEPLRRLKTLILKPMEGSDFSEFAPSRRVHAWSLWKRIKALPLHKGAYRTSLNQVHSSWKETGKSRTTRYIKVPTKRREGAGRSRTQVAVHLK